jgi:hypothetical protein
MMEKGERRDNKGNRIGGYVNRKGRGIKDREKGG